MIPVSDLIKCTRYASLSVSCAVITYFYPTDFWLVTTGISSVISGLYGLNIVLTSPASRFNFFIVSSVVISLASSLGMLFSFISISLVSPDIWGIVLDHTHTTTTDMALAQAYAILFAGILLFIGSRKKMQHVIATINQELAICLYQHRNLVAKSLATILFCQIYLINLGVIVYGGTDLVNEGEPTHPLLAIIQPVVSIVPFGLSFYLRENFTNKNRWKVVILVASLTIELYWFFLFGRRSIIYFFILLSAGIFYDRKVSVTFLIKNTIPIIICCFAILQLTDIYHKMRVVYRFEQAQRMDIIDAIGGLENVDNDEYKRLRNMNISIRTAYSSLALGQFVTLFRSSSCTPLLGRQLLGSVLFATPSNFFVDKRTIAVKEDLYEHAFSIGLTDISETLYLESFIDFGLAGMIIYPTFMLLLFLGLYALAGKRSNPLFSLAIACVSIYVALMMVEIDMITFLTIVRTLFVCYVLTLFFRKPYLNPSPRNILPDENHLPVS